MQNILKRRNTELGRLTENKTTIKKNSAFSKSSRKLWYYFIHCFIHFYTVLKKEKQITIAATKPGTLDHHRITQCVRKHNPLWIFFTCFDRPQSNNIRGNITPLPPKKEKKNEFAGGGHRPLLSSLSFGFFFCCCCCDMLPLALLAGAYQDCRAKVVTPFRLCVSPS